MIAKLIKFFGEISGFVTTILVLLVCTDVALRYFFNNSQEWVIELEWHLFALIFLFGGAYAFKKDKHVRVDIWYERISKKNQEIINLFGTIFLLIPWCLVIIFTSFFYAENSWAIGESSPDPGGLPARYIIKFSISVGFILLLFQAVLNSINSIKLIRTFKNKNVAE